MYDVAIIGAGITGCAIAYELGKYNVKAVIVEKENDVSVGTTKANSAIIHGGYDPKPGTKMAAVFAVKYSDLLLHLEQRKKHLHLDRQQSMT